MSEAPSTPTLSRARRDLSKLLMAGYEVDVHSSVDFIVTLRGPKDTLYEEGTFKVHVELPTSYPYKSPSVGFVTRIYHPNVDFASGTVCLDVLNQTWSPIYGLENVFEVFLPQLLTYPNPTDPLNPEAASLLLRNPTLYKTRVRGLALSRLAAGDSSPNPEYVRRFAMPEAAPKDSASPKELENEPKKALEQGATNTAPPVATTPEPSPPLPTRTEAPSSRAADIPWPPPSTHELSEPEPEEISDVEDDDAAGNGRSP